MPNRFRAPVVPLDTYNTREILAAAVAAYEYNGDYIRGTLGGVNVNGVGENRVGWSNKLLVNHAIGRTKYKEGFHMLPGNEKPPVLKVTDGHYQQADDIIKYMGRLSLKVISGDINHFEQKIYDALMEEETPVNNIALIAYAPKLLDKDIKRRNFIKNLKENYSASEHLGAEGSRVYGTITVLKSNYIEKIGMYAHEAVDTNGNLISFLFKSEVSPGEVRNYKAKVKSLEHNYHVPAIKQTSVNYVKFTS